MGISYHQHRMVGVEILGFGASHVYDFLEENGYTLTPQERLHFDKVGIHNLATKFKLTDIEIMGLDDWSGHDFFIGYNVGLDKETSAKVTKKIEKFQSLFPNSNPSFSSFTSVS